MANQAINKFLEQQEKKMEKVILEKIMNLEIIQNNKEILRNKLNNQNKEKNPADIAYSGDVYDPAHIEDPNKEQGSSINLENVISKILELQVTQEKIDPKQMNKANDKTSGPKESARDRNSEEKTVNLDCTKIPDEDQQITFDLEHVLSRTMGSQNERDAQKNIDKASDDISNLSESARMKDTKSNEINKSPTPSTNVQSIKESSNIISESTQLKKSAHLTSLLAEIQNDLINLEYIKNYNNPKSSMTKQSQEYINSTQAKNTQTTYFLVQSDMDHMLISEENLGKITLTNPQINTDVGIQLIQANPIN